jgi:thiol-disulfide isomerase/thioredoxin
MNERRFRMFRSWMLCLTVLAAPVFARAEAAAEPPLLKVGERAPQFGPVKLHNADEAGMKAFTLGLFAGDEPEVPDVKGVLISFFATWCGPCKKELPFLVQLDKKYKAKGLQVVSVSIDKDEEAFKGVRELIQKNAIVHPVLMDRYNLLARRYLGDKTTLPAVFLVKRDGSIALVKQGYDGDASALITAEVEKLLSK